MATESLSTDVRICVLLPVSEGVEGYEHFSTDI